MLMKLDDFFVECSRMLMVVWQEINRYMICLRPGGACDVLSPSFGILVKKVIEIMKICLIVFESY